MNKFFLTIFVSFFFVNTNLSAQEGKMVGDVAIRDASDNPINLPKLGDKNLLIFYIDPDHAGQNSEFRENLEKHQIHSPNIYSFGVINLKDAPLMPNSLVRAMIRKKAKSTNSDIFTDPSHFLRDAWKLGDVNDKFVIIFVDKSQKIVFYRAGELNSQDKKTFFNVISGYK